MGVVEHVIGHTPAIRVLVALEDQGIFSLYEAFVNLAWNDGSESEESAHPSFPSGPFQIE